MEKLLEQKENEKNEILDRKFWQRQKETNNWDYIKESYYQAMADGQFGEC